MERLEGECYDTADASCDPDFDSEHTEVVASPSRSNEAYVFLPRSGCGVNFDDVFFPSASAFTLFVAGCEAAGASVGVTVTVEVDSVPTASGSYTGNTWVIIPFTITAPVLAGTHDVRIEYVITSGPSWANCRFDYLDAVRL